MKLGQMKKLECRSIAGKMVSRPYRLFSDFIWGGEMDPSYSFAKSVDQERFRENGSRFWIVFQKSDLF